MNIFPATVALCSLFFLLGQKKVVILIIFYYSKLHILDPIAAAALRFLLSTGRAPLMALLSLSLLFLQQGK